MANLLNKLVYIKNGTSFTDELKELYKYSIVFIEDEGVLWTHKKCFGLSQSDLDLLYDRIDDIEGQAWFNGIAEIDGTRVFTATSGSTTIKFGGDSKNLVTVTVDEDGVHVSGKEVSAEGDDYVSAVASKNGDNKVTIQANVTKLDDIDESNSGEGTLVDAADAKKYIDSMISDSAVMEDDYVAEVMIGGLNSGTNIGGLSATEVLDLILKPEYAPTFTEATAGIACTGYTNGAVLEVGSKTPQKSLYVASGNKAKAVAGSYVAYGGEPTDTLTEGTPIPVGVTYDTVFGIPGEYKVTLTRNYAQGTDVVKTNKGNSTNKTGSNATTLIGNANVNSRIDASSKVIKAVSKSSTFTIKYAYKVYASTSSAGTLTSLGVKETVSNVEATLKGGAGGQMFSVPATYTNVKIEEYNATLNSWTNTTSEWEATDATMTLADGTSKAYSTYRRKNNSGEDMKARISATVGQ